MHNVFAIIFLAGVLALTSVVVKWLLETVKWERRMAAEKAAKHTRLRLLEINLRHMEVDAKSRKLSQAELDDYAAFISERNALVVTLFPQRARNLALA